MSTLDVTVVVCTYNRAALLRRTLASLAELETGGRFTYELLVVDNASTDDTPAVIVEAAARCPVPLRSVRETSPGISSARNRGLAEAHTEWIAFFDDDQLAEPQWLAALLETAEKNHVLCVGGPVFPLLPPECPAALAPTLQRLLLQTRPCRKVRRCGRKLVPTGGNIMVHRRVFAQVGGYDEAFQEGGEDTDFYHRCRRAGFDAWFNPAAAAHHLIPSSRIKPAYLRWNALRAGWVFARRDYDQWGLAGVMLLTGARLGQGLALRLPRLAWARLRGDQGKALTLSCRLWLMQSYVRRTLNLLAPRLFAQREFVSKLEFRSER
jgi:glycosyltransferase involved in cell wall biosynthesis